jgi:hypothetical protein
MNMFKTTAAKTPEEYIDLTDEPRKSELKKLHDFIRKTVPKLKPYIQTGMIGYGAYHYKSKSGSEGDWAVILLASPKNYISVHACAADGKEYVAEKYKKELPKATIGKSCISFKKMEDIDLKVLEKILKEAEKLGGINQV